MQLLQSRALPLGYPAAYDLNRSLPRTRHEFKFCRDEIYWVNPVVIGGEAALSGWKRG